MKNIYKNLSKQDNLKLLYKNVTSKHNYKYKKRLEEAIFIEMLFSPIYNISIEDITNFVNNL